MALSGQFVAAGPRSLPAGNFSETDTGRTFAAIPRKAAPQQSLSKPACSDVSSSNHTFSTMELELLQGVLKSCQEHMCKGSDRDFGRYIMKNAEGLVSFDGMSQLQVGKCVREAFPAFGKTTIGDKDVLRNASTMPNQFGDRTVLSAASLKPQQQSETLTGQLKLADPPNMHVQSQDSVAAGLDDGPYIHTFSTEELALLQDMLESSYAHRYKGYSHRDFGRYILKRANGLIPSFLEMPKPDVGRSVRAAFPEYNAQAKTVTSTSRKRKSVQNLNSTVNIQKCTNLPSDQSLCKTDKGGQFDLAGSTDIALNDIHTFSTKELKLLRDILDLSNAYKYIGYSHRDFGQIIQKQSEGLIPSMKRMVMSKVGKSVRAAFPEYAQTFLKVSPNPGQSLYKGETGGANDHGDDDTAKVHTLSAEELQVLAGIVKACPVYVRRGYAHDDFARYVKKQTQTNGAVDFTRMTKTELGMSIRAVYPECATHHGNEVFIKKSAASKVISDKQCQELTPDDYDSDVVKMSFADLHWTPNQMKLVKDKVIAILKNSVLGLTNKMLGKKLREVLKSELAFEPFSNTQIGYLISVTFSDIIDKSQCDGATRLAAKYYIDAKRKQSSRPAKKYKPRPPINNDQFGQFDQSEYDKSSSSTPMYDYGEADEYRRDPNQRAIYSRTYMPSRPIVKRSYPWPSIHDTSNPTIENRRYLGPPSGDLSNLPHPAIKNRRYLGPPIDNTSNRPHPIIESRRYIGPPIDDTSDLPHPAIETRRYLGPPSDDVSNLPYPAIESRRYMYLESPIDNTSNLPRPPIENRRYLGSPSDDVSNLPYPAVESRRFLGPPIDNTSYLPHPVHGGSYVHASTSHVIEYGHKQVTSTVTTTKSSRGPEVTDPLYMNTPHPSSSQDYEKWELDDIWRKMNQLDEERDHLRSQMYGLHAMLIDKRPKYMYD